MGFFRHHAIVVTCVDSDRTFEIQQKAREIGCFVSGVVGNCGEGCHSFLVAPDGYKEGHDGSDDDDERRNKLVAWFVEQSKVRGPIGFDWVELEFGGDTGGAKIIRHRDDPRDEATKEEQRLIPREPLMTLNRRGVDREVMPITASTMCPRCGSRALRASEHFLFEADALVLGHCEFYAVAGDTVWVNQRSCEGRDDLRKFLGIRSEAMKTEAVTA